MEAGSEEGDGLQMLKGQKKVMVPQMLKGQKKVMKNQKRKVREEMRREKVKTEMRREKCREKNTKLHASQKCISFETEDEEEYICTNLAEDSDNYQ